MCSTCATYALKLGKVLNLIFGMVICSQFLVFIHIQLKVFFSPILNTAYVLMSSLLLLSPSSLMFVYLCNYGMKGGGGTSGLYKIVMFGIMLKSKRLTEDQKLLISCYLSVLLLTFVIYKQQKNTLTSNFNA